MPSAEDSEFLAELAKNPGEALASSDIKKIESWLGKLDKKQATWL